MIKEKMKIVVCTKYGLPDVLKIKLVNKPTFKPNELFIKVMASSVNSGDVRVRGLDANFFLKVVMRLIFGFNKPRKSILGTVYSGVVEQVGSHVKDFKVGDEVYGLTGFNFGTYAEYITVKGNSVVTKKPFNATFEEAAAIPFGAQTAIYFLEKTNLFKKPNLKVLIYGATGAVGTSAIQIAKYYNAEVTTVCSDYNKEFVLNLGADRLIFYNKEDFTKSRIKYDVIFDAVGKISKRQCSHLLNSDGIFLTVGGMEYATEKKEQLEFVRDLFEKGKYKAIIDKVFTIDEIVEAHRYVDTCRKKGNVVLKIR